jgi:hypothetical protein
MIERTPTRPVLVGVQKRLNTPRLQIEWPEGQPTSIRGCQEQEAAAVQRPWATMSPRVAEVVQNLRARSTAGVASP